MLDSIGIVSIRYNKPANIPITTAMSIIPLRDAFAAEASFVIKPNIPISTDNTAVDAMSFSV